MKQVLAISLFLISSKIFALGPCGVDVKKFCPDVEKTKSKIVECIKKHEKELSPNCLERIKMAKERGMTGNSKNGKGKAEVAKVKVECGNDIQKFCATERKNKTAIIVCLRKSETKLAENCKSALSGLKAKK